jgi:Flp pilus assembly protein TadG
VTVVKPRPSSGQAIVVMALLLIVLIGMVGLAVDIGIGYYYNAKAERAAARRSALRRGFHAKSVRPLLQQQ